MISLRLILRKYKMAKDIALIRIEGDVGGLFRIRDEIKNALKARGIEVHASVDKTDRVLSVEADTTKEQIKGILSHSKVKGYHIDFQPAQYQAPKQESRGAFPWDEYTFMKKTQIPNLKEQVAGYETRISELERTRTELESCFKKERADSSAKLSGLEKSLRDVEAKCAEMADVQGVVPEMMLRESRLWESFVKFYTETLNEARELYGVSEKDILDYVPFTKTPEFKANKEKYEQARAASDASKDNPFIKLDPVAEGLVKKLDEEFEKAKGVDEARGALTKEAEKRGMRISIATEMADTEETVLTFPFKIKETYPLLEKTLIDVAANYLSSHKIVYSQHDVNGLLTYKIPDFGTRARNQLINALKTQEDVFRKLGGKRQIVETQVIG